jgi:peptide/nickel transport system substrate-binding protein
MHGQPALGADFTHFPYANPDAPKGGDVTYCVIGSFDNMNPFILNGMRTTARGVIDTVFGNLVFEPLMRRSADEAFTMYPLLAQSIDVDPERKWIEFKLNPDATWSDGTPVTPEDVLFTYDIFTEKGRPPYNRRMARVEKLEKTGDHSVKFTFNGDADREFPLIIALTPIIPKHATDAENFDKTTLSPLVGSGPYRISLINPGERVTFERNPDYWGADIASKRGFDNYDTITVEYFRDDAARSEAFKKGLCDMQAEDDPVKWQTGYDFPAASAGDVVLGTFETGLPSPMSGMIFNTRREKFADRRVREALAMLYDFEWVNRNLYGGAFKRSASFWQNSELSSVGRPASDAEKTLLEPYMSEVLPEVMDGTYLPSQTDGSGTDRDVLRKAFALFKDAGYELKESKLVNAAGTQLGFEFLIQSETDQKIALALQRTAAKLGIAVDVRRIEDSELQKRRQTWDYDMIMGTYFASLSPGIEQSGRWGSEARDAEGTFNYAGIASPGVDAMIKVMVNARERTDFVDAVRALDRLLISGHYLIPLQFKSEQWLAYWKAYKHPELTPVFGYQLDAWWFEQ